MSIFFFKRVKIQGNPHRVKKKWYPLKGLITRNTHVKYQRSSTCCSKVISKVKVLKKRVNLQSQGHRVKNNATHRKVLLQEILI